MRQSIKRVLAIDTAMNACSAAIYDVDKDICFSLHEPMQRGQAERLLPMMTEVLDLAGSEWRDVDAIAATIGPGTFTGIRIGLAAARSLALSLSIPVAGFTTLQVLAESYYTGCVNSGETPDPVCVLVETKREDFYCQIYNGPDSPQCPPFAADFITVRDSIPPGSVLVGDAVERFCYLGGCEGQSCVTSSVNSIDPGFLARFAYRKQSFDLRRDLLAPVYLREADVSVSSRPQRIIRAHS